MSNRCVASLEHPTRSTTNHSTQKWRLQVLKSWNVSLQICFIFLLTKWSYFLQNAMMKSLRPLRLNFFAKGNSFKAINFCLIIKLFFFSFKDFSSVVFLHLTHSIIPSNLLTNNLISYYYNTSQLKDFAAVMKPVWNPFLVQQGLCGFRTLRDRFRVWKSFRHRTRCFQRIGKLAQRNLLEKQFVDRGNLFYTYQYKNSGSQQRVLEEPLYIYIQWFSR